MLTGGRVCGGVRFEVSEPFVSAGWCHCTRCQRRTGVHASAGAVDGDPGIRPQYHQFTASAAVWEPLPDDGLPRYEQRRG